MRPAEVIDAVKARLNSVGVPEHVRNVRRASPSVEVNVLLGDSMVTLTMRSGITRWEMEEKLATLEARWRAHRSAEADGHQVTLEEAIALTRVTAP